MPGSKRANLIVAIVFFVVLGAMCLYGIWKNNRWTSGDGVYVIGSINEITLARNGWKVTRTYTLSKNTYSDNAIYPFEYFNRSSVGKRYFLRLLREHPEEGAALIPIIRVPDSIVIAPPDGWSEAWMKEHFPKVVEYVHDTR